MGTDWHKFIEEAHRCLKPDGLLTIMEVQSRFEDVDSVVNKIEAVGFRKVLFNPGNFFVEMRFERTEKPHSASQGSKKKRKQGSSNAAGGESAGFRSCIYKRR